MMSRSDGVAEWRRKSRFRQHRERSEVHGWRTFVADTLSWSAAMAGVVIILGMLVAVPETGRFSTMDSIEGGESSMWPAIVLVAVVLGFGLLVAWTRKMERELPRRKGDGG